MWTGAKGPYIVSEWVRTLKWGLWMYSNAGTRVHPHSNIRITFNCWCFQHAACCSLCETVARRLVLVYLQSRCLQSLPAARLNRFLFLVVTSGWSVNTIDPKLTCWQSENMALIKNDHCEASDYVKHEIKRMIFPSRSDFDLNFSTGESFFRTSAVSAWTTCFVFTLSIYNRDLPSLNHSFFVHSKSMHKGHEQSANNIRLWP